MIHWTVHTLSERAAVLWFPRSVSMTLSCSVSTLVLLPIVLHLPQPSNCPQLLLSNPIVPKPFTIVLQPPSPLQLSQSHSKCSLSQGSPSKSHGDKNLLVVSPLLSSFALSSRSHSRHISLGKLCLFLQTGWSSSIFTVSLINWTGTAYVVDSCSHILIDLLFFGLQSTPPQTPNFIFPDTEDLWLTPAPVLLRQRTVITTPRIDWWWQRDPDNWFKVCVWLIGYIYISFVTILSAFHWSNSTWPLKQE